MIFIALLYCHNCHKITWQQVYCFVHLAQHTCSNCWEPDICPLSKLQEATHEPQE